MKKGIVEILQTEMLDFTAPVIVNNLPSIDGLLVSQRQSIWAMNKHNINSNGQMYKMLKVTGRIFDYYVLGDAPLCGVLKNMGNNYVLNKYLATKGSFGNKNSRDGVGSAPRYIECKLNKYSECLLEGIKKNSVPLKWNYDATEKEPIVLPSKIPNVLTNLRMSIAVSEANKMPSHNMIDTCDSIISYIKTKDIDKSIEIIKVPDMPSGGSIIYDRDTFDKIYKTGRGSFTMLGKYTHDKNTNTLTIYEIPYTTYIENIEEELEGNLDKFSREITDYHNASDKDGLKLEIYLKKNGNVNTVINLLRRYTSFESKFACNFTLLDLDGKTPILMSLEDIITKWLRHRVSCIRNEYLHDYNNLSNKLHLLLGLQKILSNIDLVISIIKGSKNKNEAIEKIKSQFDLDDIQSKYIVEFRLININEGYIKECIKEIEEIRIEMDTINNILSSDNNIYDIIIEQLEEVKKDFGKPRLTEIIYETSEQAQTIDESALIEDYNCYITTTKQGYIYKYKRATDNFKLKDGDYITNTFATSNKATLLVFTDKGNCYKLFLHDIEERVTSQIGQFLYGILDIPKDETIISTQVTRKYEGNLVNVFENGKLALVDLQSFKTEQRRSMLKNAISLESNLINQFIVTQDEDIVCKSNIDKILITNTSQFNAKASKNTNGDNLMKSKNDSTLVYCELLKNIDTDKIGDMEYYRANRNSVGTFLKKTDEIIKK